MSLFEIFYFLCRGNSNMCSYNKRLIIRHIVVKWIWWKFDPSSNYNTPRQSTMLSCAVISILQQCARKPQGNHMVSTSNVWGLTQVLFVCLISWWEKVVHHLDFCFMSTEQPSWEEFGLRLTKDQVILGACFKIAVLE